MHEMPTLREPRALHLRRETRVSGERRRVRRFWILTLALAFLVAASGASADLGNKKVSIDARLGSVQQRINAARARADALQSQITSTTSRIRTLEARVGDVSSKLATLQSELALREQRLQQTQRLFQLQSQQLTALKAQQRLAQSRLQHRLVDIYESGDPSTVEVLLGARSIQDALDRSSYFAAIADQDKQIVKQVTAARVSLQFERVRTRHLRDRVLAERRIVAYRAAQEAQARADLLSAKGSLVGARDTKQHSLAATQETVREWQQEASSLSAASAQIQAQIAAAQATPAATPAATPSGTPTPPPSSAGLVWPVSGPITSPYGMRWGSLHPGIDVGASTGTPIHAAAAGTVLVASYNGGYGNLVVLDNGNSIATAYAHQSSIAVTIGQTVSQGQVIGYVGSTGFSTGPHLHFEVRVNGTPVDPLGYL